MNAATRPVAEVRECLFCDGQGDCGNCAGEEGGCGHCYLTGACPACEGMGELIVNEAEKAVRRGWLALSSKEYRDHDVTAIWAVAMVRQALRVSPVQVAEALGLKQVGLDEVALMWEDAEFKTRALPPVFCVEER